MRTPTPWLLPTEPATRAVLLANGVSDEMIRTQLGTGALVRLRRGVFVAAHACPQAAAGQLLVRARAEQAANPGAVLSHETAALVWQLPTPGFEPWENALPAVTLPAGGGFRSRNGDVARHVAMLPPGHVVRDPRGYAVTSVARTAIDLSADLPVPEALVILDGAARRLCGAMVVSPRRSDYTNPRLVRAAREMLAEVASVRRIARLTRVIALVEPCRESAPESLTAGHLALSDLPLPSFQPGISTPLGIFYPDCFWEDATLVGECDGAVKYADRSAYVAEKEREQALRDAGYRVVRWLAKEIMVRPDVVLSRIARALGE